MIESGADTTHWDKLTLGRLEVGTQLLWDRSLGHRPRVSSAVVPSPFQPWHLEWTPPTFLSSYSHLCLPLPSPRTLVPGCLFLPVLVPSLASRVLLTPLFLKCQIKCPPSFSKHSDGTCPAPQRREALLLFILVPGPGVGQKFAGLGEGGRVGIAAHPIPLQHPRDTGHGQGAPYPDDEYRAAKTFFYTRGAQGGRGKLTPGGYFLGR